MYARREGPSPGEQAGARDRAESAETLVHHFRTGHRSLKHFYFIHRLEGKLVKMGKGCREFVTSHQET